MTSEDTILNKSMTSTKEFSPYLEAGLEAIRKAEDLIRRYYFHPQIVNMKSDMAPVTMADKEAEKVMRECLSEKFPEHGFMGEEFKATESKDGFYWIIDPIDGTNNYIRGIPFFATELALMKDSEIVVGISNALEMNDLIYATRGGGAFDAQSKSLKVSKVESLKKAHISTGGLNHFQKSNDIDRILRVINVAGRMRAFGDAYAYHLLAAGKFESVIEAKVQIWDVAALSLIVEEAGGKVTDLAGNKLTLESTSIIASNGSVHDELVQLIKG